MTLVAVLLPVLGRPHRVTETMNSLTGSDARVEISPIYLVSPDDYSGQFEACEAAEDDGLASDVIVVGWNSGSGDYARKINHGARFACHLGADWVFLGADDLCFCENWASEAIRVGERTGRAVVGTDDLGNPSVRRGTHSTHPLVRVDYVARGGVVDEPAVLLYEGYDHQFAEAELVETAKARGEWVFAPESRVEHLHPFWGKAERDATYEKALARGAEDARLFASRRPLWEGLAFPSRCALESGV
jgi:hypothetical protein